MTDVLRAPFKRNAGLSLLALGAATGTLVCCVLPAVMVALGAGAALAGLVTAVPQLVWLSEHKGLVFGFAVGMLMLSGVLLLRARNLPCPIDPASAGTCLRLRRLSRRVWWIAAIATGAGAAFAFLLPRL